MHSILRSACLVLGLALPVMAQALEASAVVKSTPVLKATASWDGKPIVYPAGQGEVTGLVIEIAAGGETGWHSHPVPSFAYILEGSLEVTRKDGQVRVLNPGDALAEVVDVPHNGRVLGDKPVKLVVFYVGAVGRPLSIKHTD